MPSVVFAGTCWACGGKSFVRTCPELPPPENWFGTALDVLRSQGWVFLWEEGGKLRAYCKACWDRTEG